MFLLGPEDSHYFEIATSTQFCFIRFMEVFIREETPKKPDSWQQTLEFLLNTPYQSRGSIVRQEEEKKILNHLLEVLLQEYQNRQESSYPVIMI